MSHLMARTANGVAAVMAVLGGTMPSSQIFHVPLAQGLCSFFVLRWCLRSGIENMTRDGTPPGPADLPAWEAEIRCHPRWQRPLWHQGPSPRFATPTHGKE